MPARQTPKVPKPATARRKRLSADEIEEIFRRFHAANPEPKGELEYVNAYTLLVAVVLSAQATDVGVNKATRALFRIADTPQKMLALGLKGVSDHIKTIGLYNAKAKNVIALSELLILRHGGEVPTTREELEALPGVGRKTANVVLNIAFGRADDCGRYASVPRRQPDRPRVGQEPAGGGASDWRRRCLPGRGATLTIG